MTRLKYLPAIVFIGLYTFVVAAADTEFTYQGELNQNGQVTNGAFDFEFVLWDALAGGSQVGTPTVINDVQVSGGRFIVELDFGASAFDNSARWLEIAVNGNTLSPRQPINRSPYSIQTRGIFVNENNKVGIGTSSPFYPLHVETDSGFSIFGLSQGTNGRGVSGWATADTSTNSGVYGQSNSTAGRGVSGFAAATSGANYGVHGLSNGMPGRGVYGEAANSSGGTYGVYGLSRSTSGRGVYGVASNFSGTNYGVLGETNSASGYAGAFFGGRNYFEGSVGIGTEEPQSKLHIAHAAVGTGWGVRIDSAATSNNQGGMRISNDGFFDVTNKANIGSPNFARLNSAGVWTVVSDRRMKEEIAPLTGVLDRAMRLDPVSYWFKNQDRERMPDRQIGLIAQEVDSLFPSLVSQGGDLLTMDYSGLGVVAIAAIQELKHQTDVEMNELRDEKDVEVVALRDENNALRTRLDSLEQQDADRQLQIQDLQRLVERLTSNTEESAK